MADEILKEISKAISDSMSRIVVTMHDSVAGECPVCHVPAPCKDWMDAKDRLAKEL